VMQPQLVIKHAVDPMRICAHIQCSTQTHNVNAYTAECLNPVIHHQLMI